MTASATTTVPPHSRRPSLISPAVDTLLVGGLSLIAFILLLLSGRTDLVLVSTGAQAWLAAMLNMPHFLAQRSPAMVFVAQALGERPGQVAPVILLAFLNIHHYFTDGVIWKIGDPEVRRALFAHVPRPDASPHAGGREARKA